MNLGPHAAFIIAAYVVAFSVVTGLIAWIIADHRIQRRALVDLESKGVTRRSAEIRPTAIKPIKETA
jgi:heme exporter protein D